MSFDSLVDLLRLSCFNTDRFSLKGGVMLTGPEQSMSRLNVDIQHKLSEGKSEKEERNLENVGKIIERMSQATMSVGYTKGHQ